MDDEKPPAPAPAAAPVPTVGPVPTRVPASFPEPPDADQSAITGPAASHAEPSDPGTTDPPTSTTGGPAASVPEPTGPSGPAPHAPSSSRTSAPAAAERGDGDGDSLPAELDVTAYVGQYTFPDIRRRRWPGYVYLLVATVCFALWATRGDDAVLVNGGMLGAALALLAVGAYHLAAAWPLSVRDGEALVAAARQVGFPVGHASAQLGWRGLRSRPTWRILLYSNEDPPKQRGLVLVDAVDGGVLDHFVEDNPEDWASYDN